MATAFRVSQSKSMETPTTGGKREIKNSFLHFIHHVNISILLNEKILKNHFLPSVAGGLVRFAPAGQA